MTGVRTAEDKAESRLCEENFTKKQVPVQGSVEIRKNTPARLSLTLGEKTVTAIGQIPDEAKSAPLSREELLRRMTKLGGTPFSLAEADLTLTLDDGIFLPAGALNALRRDAVDALLGGEPTPRELTYKKSRIARPALPLRVAVCHMPFLLKQKPPFDIEEELYIRWTELLGRMGIQYPICGHMHQLMVLRPDDERLLSKPDFVTLVGSETPQDFTGAHYTLSGGALKAVFTGADGHIRMEAYA